MGFRIKITAALCRIIIDIHNNLESFRRCSFILIVFGLRHFPCSLTYFPRRPERIAIFVMTLRYRPECREFCSGPRRYFNKRSTFFRVIRFEFYICACFERKSFCPNSMIFTTPFISGIDGIVAFIDSNSFYLIFACIKTNRGCLRQLQHHGTSLTKRQHFIDNLRFRCSRIDCT